MKKLLLITAGILVTAAMLVVLLLMPSGRVAPTPQVLPPTMPLVRETDYRAVVLTRVIQEAGLRVDPTGGPAGLAGPAGVLPLTALDRMIIRIGDLGLVVEDVVDARDEIARLAVRLGGHVASSQISGEDQWMRGWITIRVPYDNFEQALAEFRGLAVRVTTESTSSRDVTEEYIDLESRLRNAEATEEQFLVLLGKAETVEDILRVYDRLSRVRTDIEQIKGRMQYLERTAAMSLISVRLEPEVIADPLVRPDWNPGETFYSALRAIITFAQYLGTIAIWLIIFIPVWGTVLGVIYYWCRRRKVRAIL